MLQNTTALLVNGKDIIATVNAMETYGKVEV
jgi:hypothetical protein